MTKVQVIKQTQVVDISEDFTVQDYLAGLERLRDQGYLFGYPALDQVSTSGKVEMVSYYLDYHPDKPLARGQVRVEFGTGQLKKALAQLEARISPKAKTIRSPRLA